MDSFWKKPEVREVLAQMVVATLFVLAFLLLSLEVFVQKEVAQKQAEEIARLETRIQKARTYAFLEARFQVALKDLYPTLFLKAGEQNREILPLLMNPKLGAMDFESHWRSANSGDATFLPLHALVMARGHLKYLRDGIGNGEEVVVKNLEFLENY